MSPLITRLMPWLILGISIGAYLQDGNRLYLVIFAASLLLLLIDNDPKPPHPQW